MNISEKKQMRSDARQIAETIRKQLGGSRFVVMTGAHSFSFETDGSLIFKLPAKGCRAYGVKITLNTNDLYDVEFIRIKRDWTLDKNVFENVYVDQLVSVFEAETGLRTSL